MNEALNSENRERAINTLLALLRTRHYTSLGKEALLTLIGEKDEPLPMQLQIVQAIYQYTTEEPDELHEIARSLLNRFQDEELLFEQ